MHKNVERLNLIKNKIKEIIEKKQLKNEPEIIAVSKTFQPNQILPLLDAGHIHFGENKIQEAENKWVEMKKNNLKIQLHMVGKLQSNKAKKAIQLFDYIHSLDNEKLALKLNQYEKELNKKVRFFIQVNVDNEKQKSGISLSELNSFYNYCTKELSLNIIGLMCLPPINLDPSKFFKIIKENSDNLNLRYTSMGMSTDYEEALLNGSTHLRLGASIFGERKIN
tara:strand:+ start:83 stop:751 length:669 start_codon:yes stop_codon:yes gene_type:complete